MRATVKNHAPAVVCAATLLVCYFVIQPYAEIGFADDWSYIKTAQLLAQTGHIVYNGWASPMLGWQLYFGALFIKLFGFSFTVVRFCTAIEAMATAFLLQRTFVRAGLNSWNATLTTMTFVLSALYLPLAFTFLTDISGVLCIVACLYMCLRAVQAQSERSAMIWISLAALVNAVGGTARQIVWLGVLVMVPSTLWLLRRSRRVLVVGGLSCMVGAGIVAAAMQWFARQPYAIPQSLLPGNRVESLKHLLLQGLLGAGQLALMALPILLMFTVSLPSWRRRVAAGFGAGLFSFFLPGTHELYVKAGYGEAASYFGGYPMESTSQRLNEIVACGAHLPTHDFLGSLLTGATALGILSLAVCLFVRTRGRPVRLGDKNSISWQKLGLILGPFSIVYIVVLALNMLLNGMLFGRYFLPLFLILLLILARYYQEKVKMKLPCASGLLVVIFGGFTVVAAHDDFAWFRGNATAINEMRSSGVPATAILGPWEYLGWAEIETVGHINDDRIRVPKGAYVPPQPLRPDLENCDPDLAAILKGTPAIRPAYVVSPDPAWCGGKIAFPPMLYRTWVAPRANWLYAVKLPTSP